MAGTWDKSTFDSLYKTKAWSHGTRGWNKPISFNYQWWGQRRRTRALANTYLTLPGMASIQDIAIVGGGFGWTAEVLAESGRNAISVDIGDYIIANENVSEEQEIRDTLTAQGLDPDNLPIFMDPNDPNREMQNNEIWGYWLRPDGKRTSIPVEQEDLSTNASVRNVKQRLGNNIDVILSEFVLDSMETDAEALSVIENCERLRPNPACNVVHILSTGLSTKGPVLLNKDRDGWRALLDSNGFTDHYIFDRGPEVLF